MIHRYLIIFISILNQINCDCLYPQWKQTCQKYCMDNQLYEIQLNQCYSMDPNQLTCKCSGKILTDKIKKIIENKTFNKSSLLITNTIVYSSISENITCKPSHSCTIGKTICNGIDAFCKCDNGTWINNLCSKENICKIQNSIASCQLASSNEHISLFSMSGLASSIKINEYFYIFIIYLLFLHRLF